MAETGRPYPDAIDGMLADLTARFNAIHDDEVVNQLQKECVAKVEDASVGRALAQSVRAAFKQVRAKDVLAARIIALTQLFDGLVAEAEAEHQRSFRVPPGPTRKALVALVQHFDSGGTADRALAGLAPEDHSRLAEYFEVPGASPEQIGAIAELYIAEAMRTRAVEDGMRSGE